MAHPKQTRFQLGAYLTHRARTTRTDSNLERAVGELLRAGKRPSIAAVARKMNMSREHLSRRYGRSRIARAVQSWRVPFKVTGIGHRLAKPFIEQWHYSHRMPTGRNVCFGAFHNGELYCVAAYGIGVNPYQARSLARTTGLPAGAGESG